MKILDFLYERLNKSKDEKEKELVKYQEIRDEAYKLGDLSENNDYEEAVKNINNLAQEIVDIQRIMYNAEIVQASELTSTIEVGTWFNLKAEYKGKRFENEDVPEHMREFLKYDPETDMTTFCHDVVFGAPLDDFTSDFILSSTSSLADYLIGKPKSKSVYTSPSGIRVTLEVSPREGV